MDKQLLSAASRCLLTVMLASLLVGCGRSPSVVVEHPEDVLGREVSLSEMEAGVLAIMEKASVAGLSVSVINGREITYSHSFGFANVEEKTPMDDETVLAGASFSKTVFAYLVTSLASDGYLNLDTPVVDYLQFPVSEYPRFADLAEDERHKSITARSILSHSTGLPNSRIFMPGATLGFNFSPGENFGYSAEGFELLQLVVEEVMGKGIEELSRERIFGPFKMRRTSFEWQDRFDGNHAMPHDKWNRPHFLRKRAASAAGSLFTTSADFARFIVGNVTNSANDIIGQMFDAQIAIHSESMFGPGAQRESEESTKMNLAWGLGWGLYDSSHGRAMFRTGHGDGAQNYTVFFPDIGTGIVLLSNSDNFESVAAEIVELVIADSSSPYDWLGYVAFDPSTVTDPPGERISINVNEETLMRYVGVFAMPDFDLTYFKVEDGSLYYSSDNKHWEMMLAESETRFFFRHFPYTYEFVVDENGLADRMDTVIDEYGIRMPSWRIAT